MTGFDVASLAPFRGGQGAAKLGLRPLDAALWRDTGPELAARAAGKAAVFAAAPDALHLLPHHAAAAELAALVGADGVTLRDAALVMFEDVCILERDPGGRHIFTAGALAYPTDWHLHEKIGLPLAGVHAPVPGYAARLAAGVDHVFDTLTAARLLTRTNWNIVETDTLRYLPALPAAQRFDHVSIANAGVTLWLRCERQVLRRLPASGAAVFTIGVYREQLCNLPADLVHDLATAVARLPAAEGARRGTSGYAAALSGYAAGLVLPPSRQSP
jgi:dimethylamine monooxygenase subunit A